MVDGPLKSGFSLDEFSKSVRAQDDLFLYVNESWIESTPIPPDRSSYGAFEILREMSEEAIREIVEEAQSATSGEPQKFGDLYTSFMDEERVEELGGEPLRETLETVGQVSSVDSLLRTIGDLQHQGQAGFYSVFVDNDPGNPERYLVFFEQGGLSLPDESYYRDEQFASVREAYITHVQRMFDLAGLSDPEERAKRVFDLETEIAVTHWDKVSSRDSEKTYNPMIVGRSITTVRSASRPVARRIRWTASRL